MTIRTFLVDDEPKSVSILQNKLERFCPQINIVGTSHNPQEAVSMIKDLEPDLVFLDIQMPELNGFELLGKFENPFFEVIFATAYNQHAIEAINYSAVGYILKPYDNDELMKAVNRAEENIRNKVSLMQNTRLLETIGITKFNEQKIMIPNRDGVLFIKTDEIICCVGEDGYTRVHLSGGKSVLSSQSIGKFYEVLPETRFFQTHKSHIVNLRMIAQYLNEGYLILENDFKIPVSRQKREELFILLKSK